MVIENEKERFKNAIFQTRIQCLDCHCIGVLRKKGEKTYLFPQEVLTTRSIHTRSKHVRRLKTKRTWKKIAATMSLAKHGNATDRQLKGYLTLGSLFWITVILAANFASVEKLRGVTTFLTSTCHRKYKECVKVSTMDYCGHLMKQCHATREFILPAAVSKIEHVKAAPLVFTDEENDVNLYRCQKKQFYDQKVCRHICSNTLVLKSTRTTSISPCESMCFELTKSSDAAGEVCPFQKYCQKGCPCPYYECEKLESPQKLVPVFDLRKSDNSSTSTQSIQLTSTLSTTTTSIQSTSTSLFNSAGKFDENAALITSESELTNFPILLADFNGQNQPRKTNASQFLNSYSTGATFLNGEHYLVDAVGNLLKVKENGDAPIIIPNRLKNIGRFFFHFRSSIGTHQIEIRLKDKDRKIFPVVVICSPNGRQDKCFYYAPEYNLERFETAQGYIASNHFNARTSSISFGGTFYLMSLRLGVNWITLSKTVALNSIRSTEELEKGWRKDEITVPAMFRDFDPVHVIPLIDLGKLMLILVTRSIALSNMQYSLLLEKEGKFLTLGSEWIGSFVKYEQESRCLSGLYAPNDYAYSNPFGTNNDECKYFINGFINNDRIFFQNIVFDTTFEVYFDFERIELDFKQQGAKNKMLVSSNPFFKFHEDVFPNFAKNAVDKQLDFPQSASSLSPPYPLVILPDFPFASFNESLFHISSFEFDLNETRKLTFDIKTKSPIIKASKILEFRSYNEKSIFAIETFENRSIAISSDFFEDSIAVKDFLSIAWTSLDFVFKVEEESFLFFVVKKNDDEIGKRKMKNDFQLMKEKRVRVFKFDEKSQIKNLFFFQNRPSQINVILSEYNLPPAQYALFGDGFKGENSKIIIPKRLEKATDQTLPVLVNDQLHLFGGSDSGKRILRLDGCRLTCLATRLRKSYHPGSSALSISNGSEALVCFNTASHPEEERQCEIFDGEVVEQLLFETKEGHDEGSLCLYKGQPTAVGGQNYPESNEGYTETLTENGWKELTRHPRWIEAHSTVGFPSGSMATLGGWDREGEALTEIWRLRESEWTIIGQLLQPNYYTSSILVDNTVYVFPGDSDGSSIVIQRVKLESDEVTQVETIGHHPRYYAYPIVFLSPMNFCSV